MERICDLLVVMHCAFHMTSNAEGRGHTSVFFKIS